MENIRRNFDDMYLKSGPIKIRKVLLKFRSSNISENLDYLEENLRKKWRKFIRKFDEVFEKISGNLG